MINTTIYSGCDRMFCYNLDLVSIIIGFGLGVIIFMLITRKHWKNKKQGDGNGWYGWSRNKKQEDGE